MSLNNSSQENEICVCEVDGRLCSVPKDKISDILKFTRTIDKHPSIFILRESLHGAASISEINRNVFLPVEEPKLKKIVHVWYEQGFIEALHAASDPDHSDSQPSTSTKIAQFLIKCIDNLSKFLIYMRPSLQESGQKLISTLSTTNNWSANPVRCIAWHPNLTKVAVALLDDTIRIYSSNSNLVPTLKLRRQKTITCMQWRPMTHSELAVGCEQVIIVWNIDPNSVVIRPSSNNANVFYASGHAPIVSIAWSPFGDLLASAAACDTSIRIWDVDINKSETLCRSAGGGKSIVRWSPDGSKLFTASLGIIFRIWDCTNWTAERWDVGEGRVQAACFSPCGTILLFCTTNEPTIFALRSNTQGIWANSNENATQKAMPILNLSRAEDKSELPAGFIRDLCWSSNGAHLAVLFKESKSVALFNTITHPMLKISLCCYVNGLEYETPNAISFQPNFEYGSCLTIVWSSGRVQYFPLITSSSTIRSLRGIYQEQVDTAVKQASFRTP